MVKCPLYAHFGILQEVVGHLGTFWQLFYEYCEYGHSSFVTYVISDAAVVFVLELK